MDNEDGVFGLFWCLELGLECGLDPGPTPPKTLLELCIDGDMEGEKPEAAGLNVDDAAGPRGMFPERAGNWSLLSCMWKFGPGLEVWSFRLR